eukprot:TRINITY_DN2303_c0_g1_i2.p1 TRINITY_DN2303_c0_g1~~TRINITY_DN2303_c0_g1_i2.p1  ORF type:complete len:300 (+),score=94.72 TRINITY_DN2303_c0_g1_i2:111-902(+)
MLAKSSSPSYHVYATMRDVSKKDKLVAAAGDTFDKSLFLLPLDVSSQQSIDDAVKKIVDKEGKIDVLVNNAGAGMVGAAESLTEAQALSCMDTNFMGVFRCCKAVLPSMKSRKSGVIVSVTSIGGLWGVPFNEIYCAAKAAVENFTESLQPIGKHFNIRLHLVEPGAISTEFVGNANKHFDGMDDATKAIFQTMMGRMMANFDKSTAQTPDQVAELIRKTIEDEKAPFRLMTNPSEIYTVPLNNKYADPTGNKVVELSANKYF